MSPVAGLRAVYADLDGTLFGPGGSLYAARGGGITDRAAGAVGALHRAGVAIVPMSGRTEAQVAEVARVLGAEGFIAELGGVVGRDGTIEHRHGAAPEGMSPVDAMLRGGGAGFLLERAAGRLEPYAPWAFRGRECTMLLRGNVDLAVVGSALTEGGYGWLHLVDNGIIPRRFPGLDLEEVHAYHLAPRGVSKRAAVEHDLAARDLERGHAAVIGDSPADLEAGAAVGSMFLVANGAWAAERSPDAGSSVRVTTTSNGDGFAEAVGELLAG